MRLVSAPFFEPVAFASSFWSGSSATLTWLAAVATVSSSRGVGAGCVQYYLDDMPFVELAPGDINRFVTGGEVVAVEVYQGVDAPAQYTRAGADCTTIILWTRFKIRS